MNNKQLNSITKYPSILTYHNLDKKGRIIPGVLVDFATSGSIIATEKVDGTNARLVQHADGRCWIGSREELIWENGNSLTTDPTQKEIETEMLPLVSRLEKLPAADGLRILYCEVFGGNIGQGARNYSSNVTRRRGARLFDVAHISADEMAGLSELSPERISTWRKNGGQQYVPESELACIGEAIGILLTPRLRPLISLPSGLKETLELMRELIHETLCALDNDACKRPEGIVFRTADRSVIAKARFIEYERALERG